ncbi:retrotransposon protein, putative, ty1-copia subclass [Tanacetum coccineum]
MPDRYQFVMGLFWLPYPQSLGIKLPVVIPKIDQVGRPRIDPTSLKVGHPDAAEAARLAKQLIKILFIHPYINIPDGYQFIMGLYWLAYPEGLGVKLPVVNPKIDPVRSPRIDPVVIPRIELDAVVVVNPRIEPVEVAEDAPNPPHNSSFSLLSVLGRERLTGLNYMDWIRNLRFTLRYENKEYVLDEQIPTINNESTQDKIEAHQKHFDDANKVSRIMAASMSPELQNTFEFTWAYEMNQKLKEMFQAKVRKEQLDVVKSLMACKPKTRASICAFVLEMKGYFDMLESLNMVFDAELSINIILSGMPPDYNQFVLPYQMNGKETFIMKLHILLQTAEQGIKKIDVPSTSAAPLKAEYEIAPTSDPKEAVCFYYNIKGHWKHSCPKYPKDLQDGKVEKGSHSDVCGPFRYATKDEKCYYVTFTDDFSRYGYVYLVKHKSDTFEVFKRYQNEVKNQLGRKIKMRALVYANPLKEVVSSSIIDEHMAMEVQNVGPNPPLHTQEANSGNAPGKPSYATTTRKPNRKKVNVRTLFTPGSNGIDVVVLVDSIRAISKYGLVRSMFSSSTGLFAFKFSSKNGLDSILENGPSFIQNNLLILKKWHSDENLLKEDDGLNAIATKLGTPLMLDSYTSDMCMQSWGRSSYAKVMIELRTDVDSSGNKKKSVEPTIEVSNSNPFDVLNSIDNDVEFGTNGGGINLFSSNTPIGEKIDKIERQIYEGKLRLLDNDGNPLVPTGIVESDSEVEMVFDETTNLRISTSGKYGSDKGYGTNSLLEQWRDSYPNNDYYDPYDDDMYENHDLSEHLESICDDLDITVCGRKKK